MRKRFLLLVVSLVGAVFFAPNPWASVARAQTTILDVTATLSSSDPSGAPRQGSYQKRYTVSMTAGQPYRLLLQAVDPLQPWPGDDNYMYLLSPSGAVVAQDDDSGSGTQHDSVNVSFGAALINYTPTATGDYTVVATTYSSAISMTFRLSVTGLPAPPPPSPPTPLPVPGSANGTLSPDSTNPRGATFNSQRFAVNLVAGSNYTIRVTPTVVGDDSYVYLLSPGGSVVASDDDGDMSTQIWASRMTYTASSTGTYIIVATSFSANQSWGFRVSIDGPPSNVGGIPNVRLAPLPPGADFARPALACHLDLAPEPFPAVTALPPDRHGIVSAIENSRIG